MGAMREGNRHSLRRWRRHGTAKGGATYRTRLPARRAKDGRARQGIGMEARSFGRSPARLRRLRRCAKITSATWMMTMGPRCFCRLFPSQDDSYVAIPAEPAEVIFAHRLNQRHAERRRHHTQRPPRRFRGGTCAGTAPCGDGIPGGEEATRALQRTSPS